MTRDFNKQNRDDSRSSFRNTPSRRFGEERSSRPARPRLNREMVDRAWENGATRTHADYRPRTNNGQSSRSSWNRNQSSEHTNFGTPDRRRTSGNRQEPYQSSTQRFERPSGNGPRSRSFEESRHTTEEQPFGNRRGHTNDSFNKANGRRNTRPQGGNNYRGPRDENGPGHRGASRFAQPERNSSQGRDNYRPSFKSRTPRSSERDARANPRWLSRPETQKKINQQQAEHYSHPQDYSEQFEGDYEQFNTDNAVPQNSQGNQREFERGNRRPPFKRPYTDKKPERHVTPMPDGRVLKGSRPAQRKNAEFWTEIHNDTENLVSHVEVSDDDNIEADSSEPATRAYSARKSSRVPASTQRRKKSITSKKPRSQGPKPSKKGFKWPTE